MKVYYYQRHKVAPEIEKKFTRHLFIVRRSFNKIGFYQLHVPLTKETYHLIDNKRLSLIKKTAYLINTARGPVIDEKALCQKLKNNEIAGAALDVYENEPIICEDLFKLNNVILTPHIGSASYETRSKMSLMVAKDVIQSLNGEKPDHLVWEKN